MINITRPAGDRRKIICGATAIVCLAMLKAYPLFSQSKSDPKRVAIAFSAGVGRPSDKSFRDLYGAVQHPFSVQADYELYKHILVFSGYGYVTRSGRTRVADSDLKVEGDPLKLRIHSVKVGLLYGVPLHRLTLLGGGGAGFNYYREKWEAAQATTTGSKVGFLAQGGAEYALSRRFSLIGRIEYSHVPIKAKSAIENDTDLGRLEFSLGLSVNIRPALQK